MSEPSAVEVIAGALAKHHPTRGMAVAMGVTCACGEWRQGGRRAAGSDGLDPHRAEAVLAALIERGFTMQPPVQKPSTVDGRVDRCPAPGYAGHHTAVGAGAVTSPYRCHGCGAWFTLDEVQP